MAEQEMFLACQSLRYRLLQGTDRGNVDIGDMAQVEHHDTGLAEQILDLGAEVVGVAEEHDALQLQHDPEMSGTPKDPDIALRPDAAGEQRVAAVPPPDQRTAHVDDADQAGKGKPREPARRSPPVRRPRHYRAEHPQGLP